MLRGASTDRQKQSDCRPKPIGSRFCRHDPGNSPPVVVLCASISASQKRDTFWVKPTSVPACGIPSGTPGTSLRRMVSSTPTSNPVYPFRTIIGPPKSSSRESRAVQTSNWFRLKKRLSDARIVSNTSRARARCPLPNTPKPLCRQPEHGPIRLSRLRSMTTDPKKKKKGSSNSFGRIMKSWWPNRRRHTVWTMFTPILS
mmetsp:Transcript_22140/g.52408  ORF Transcript_22140/g.52408 Transcript_22140/m.52408 type:complete len:200 (-) Transcript_22140:60-659(-)